MNLRFAVGLLFVAGCGGATVEVAAGDDPGDASVSKPDAAAVPAACGASGASAMTLTTLSAPPLAIASDGTDLFWLDTFAPGAPATVRAVPISGGTPRVVTTFSLWNAWVGYCDVTYPDSGVDPGGGTDSSCNTFSLVVQGDTAYAIGPVGVVSVPKAGGTARALVTLGLPNDFVLGPAVESGNALFWVQDHVPEDPDVGETVTIQRLDLGSGSASTLLTEPPSGATEVQLATDADSVYWVSGGAIQATPLTGGAATTVVGSSSLNVGGLAIVGNRVVWVNDEVSGGTCGVCGPPPTPEPEMVQFAAVAGGATTTLITYPLATDPYVSVFGDSKFAYVVTSPETDGPGPANSTLEAYPLASGSPTMLLTDLPLDLTAIDACNVYFASGNALEKIAKPAN